MCGDRFAKLKLCDPDNTEHAKDVQNIVKTYTSANP